MMLSKLLGVCKCDVVSITGAGGKTSFMFTLAEELRASAKILVTTTTKIYVPSEPLYDYLHIGNEKTASRVSPQSCGIYVLGQSINEDNKIIGYDENVLNEIFPAFDYTLIEADGAKEKQIKGWNKNEPVICSKTTITAGILDISVIGEIVSEKIVHRVERFCSITGACQGESISVQHLVRLITHEDGLFKGSAGNRVLFINKVENQEQALLVEKLCSELAGFSEKFMYKIAAGSLMKKTAHLIWERSKFNEQ